ncbi:TSPAN11 [Branchiostoma lanceolatum]|uniref:TSPAN11 protein n=1 Tax=Branchiostoma lanceolatum TaxID=7740 RepID=A0A8K0EK41_BRALA|nr:TSPAN11 [Branchiostoma lanceolatum]
MAASNMIRYFLFAFNFFCWVGGLALLAIGIWLRVDPGLAPVVTLELGWFYSAVYIIIIAGVVTIAIGFLGCCGAMRENSTLLKAYVGLLALMFLLEVVAGILGFVYRGLLDRWIRDSFSRTFDGRYIDDFPDTFQDAVVYFQRRMDCCGLNTPFDWENWQEVDSCPCPIDRQVNTYDWNEKCQEDRHDRNLSVYRSCWDNISLWLKNHIIVIGIVGLAVCLVQCLGIYCGVKLSLQYGNGDDQFLSRLKSPIKIKKAKKDVPLQSVTTPKDEGESLVKEKEKDQPPPKEPEVEAAVTTKEAEPSAPAEETEPLSPPAETAEAKENEA